MKKLNLDELEEAKFKIDESAFKPRELTCSKCNTKMKNTEIEVALESGVFVKVNGFECTKCKKKYFGLDEARKLDRAMVLNRLLSKNFKMERNLSFDGDNWTFRIPKEFAHFVHDKKIEIVPLGAGEFCASVK
ncbi:hypothetical protein JXA85_07460 [Candidatus Woesearchaeota archaeon]|nr:hypothetical protein [Candidatus Woesearchaeota archaeon]